jgi:hypothetical protein
VTTHGQALEFASDELKNDRKIVLASVKRNGYALIFASDELKNDREIVLATVTEYRSLVFPNSILMFSNSHENS